MSTPVKPLARPGWSPPPGSCQPSGWRCGIPPSRSTAPTPEEPLPFAALVRRPESHHHGAGHRLAFFVKHSSGNDRVGRQLENDLLSHAGRLRGGSRCLKAGCCSPRRPAAQSRASRQPAGNARASGPETRTGHSRPFRLGGGDAVPPPGSMREPSGPLRPSPEFRTRPSIEHFSSLGFSGAVAWVPYKDRPQHNVRVPASLHNSSRSVRTPTLPVLPGRA